MRSGPRAEQCEQALSYTLESDGEGEHLLLFFFFLRATLLLLFFFSLSDLGYFIKVHALALRSTLTQVQMICP
jgi:hypothetical protein